MPVVVDLELLLDHSGRIGCEQVRCAPPARVLVAAILLPAVAEVAQIHGWIIAHRPRHSLNRRLREQLQTVEATRASFCEVTSG